MKRDKIIYWVVTGLLAAGMGMSSVMYLTRNPELMAGFKEIALPEYFVGILGVAKLLGTIALVAPIGNRLKEWAYAGFIFTFVGAASVHILTGTPFFAPLVFLAITAVSYIFWIRVKAATPAAKPAV